MYLEDSFPYDNFTITGFDEEGVEILTIHDPYCGFLPFNNMFQ